MRALLLTLAVLMVLLSVGALLRAQALPAGEGAPDYPQLSEPERMALTVMQLQVENATLRLRGALAELKKPGYHVDIAGGQWVYVPDAPEKK